MMLKKRPCINNKRPMKTKIQNSLENGIDRIDQIKKEISQYKTQVCKAEVYETWDNIFEPEEQ